MITGIRLLIRPGGFMDPGEAERAERVLASARSILAVAALIAIYIDPTEPTRYYLLAHSVLLAYVLYSVSPGRINLSGTSRSIMPL